MAGGEYLNRNDALFYLMIVVAIAIPGLSLILDWTDRYGREGAHQGGGALGDSLADSGSSCHGEETPQQAGLNEGTTILFLGGCACLLFAASTYISFSLYVYKKTYRWDETVAHRSMALREATFDAAIISGFCLFLLLGGLLPSVNWWRLGWFWVGAHILFEIVFFKVLKGENWQTVIGDYYLFRKRYLLVVPVIKFVWGWLVAAFMLR